MSFLEAPRGILNMIKEHKLNRLKEENEAAVEFKQPFRVIPGGKDGTTDNWLSNLEPGTIFLARPNGSKELLLNNYLVSQHMSVSTNLRWITPEDRVLDIWVPTLEFSRTFKLHEIIGNVRTLREKQEDGVTDADIHGGVPHPDEPADGSPSEEPSGPTAA